MIWLILIFAFLLRLINIDQSLWLDEAISALVVKEYTFEFIFNKFSLGDFHPPLYYLLLKLWASFFGFNELSLRFPSVILSVATVWFIYLIGNKLFSQKTGLLAAILLSTAPLHIYYSQEARMYALITFLVSLSFYFLLKLSERRIFILGYLITSLMILYTDYPAYFILLAQGIYIMLFKKIIFKKFIMAISGALILTIPWFFNLYHQIQSALLTLEMIPNLSSALGEASIKNFLLVFVKFAIGRISLENQILYGILLAALFFTFSIPIFFSIRKLDEKRILLLLWIFIPSTSLLVISYFIPVFSYFRLLFILPVFLLLVASGIFINKAYLKTSYFIIGILIIINIFSIIIFNTNPKFQRENWKLATNTMENVANNGVILFENKDLFPPFVYYSKNILNVMPALTNIPANSFDDVIDVEKLDKKQVFLFEYLVDITDPSRFVEKKLESKGYKKIHTYNFEGVGFVHLYGLK